MRRKRKVGIDLDDVSWDFNGPFIPYANSILGTTVTWETHHSFVFREVYGVPNNEMLVHVERFCHDYRLHGRIPAVPGAVRGQAILAERYELPAITSRCESIRTQTVELAYVLGFQNLQDFHFTNSTTLRPDFLKRKKSAVCVELGVEVLIDDALHNAIDVTKQGINAILMDRPWNQTEIDPPGVHRVGNWQEGSWGWEEVPDLVHSLLS